MNRPTLDAFVHGLICALIAWWIEAELDGFVVAFLVTTGVAAYRLGRRWPDHILRTGCILWVVPYLYAVLAALLSGELTNPTRSTGGMFALSIWTMLMLPWLLGLWFLGGFGSDRANESAESERSDAP